MEGLLKYNREMSRKRKEASQEEKEVKQVSGEDILVCFFIPD